MKLPHEARPSDAERPWRATAPGPVALGMAFAPPVMRVLRASLVEVYHEDYIRQARLRQHGLNPFTYTYGQPRPGLGGFRDRFESELPDRLIRFVNQDDIVPRVPPGLIYSHIGIVKSIKSLDSEDSSFGLESMGGGESAAPPEIVDEELPAMSDEEEFAALQASLQNANGENFEGLFDLFTDHFMTEYVRLLTEIRGAVA